MSFFIRVYIAAPGTPLKLDGGTSTPGHMFYVVGSTAVQNRSAQRFCFGFAPTSHGDANGPGSVYATDEKNYVDPYYSRTLEISQQQFDTLKGFGMDPSNFGFSMQYNGLTNSCVDFTWCALMAAKLFRRVFGMTVPMGEGDVKPVKNVMYVRQIPAPFPKSVLNAEKLNAMPKRSVGQFLLTESGQRRGGQATRIA